MRQHFGETNHTVNLKLRAVLAAGLKVILCVGETKEERESGLTIHRVGEQLREGLAAVDAGPDQLVIAYEPVWAIGTGLTATPAQAQEVHAFIRQELSRLLGTGDPYRIQYGGSVTPDNATTLLAQPDIDGALVGGASLKPELFLPIIHAAG